MSFFAVLIGIFLTTPLVTSCAEAPAAEGSETASATFGQRDAAVIESRIKGAFRRAIDAMERNGNRIPGSGHRNGFITDLAWSWKKTGGLYGWAAEKFSGLPDPYDCDDQAQYLQGTLHLEFNHERTVRIGQITLTKRGGYQHQIVVVRWGPYQWLMDPWLNIPPERVTGDVRNLNYQKYAGYTNFRYEVNYR